jgi:DNA (cytosine-5)-methyltransferase 1
LAGEAMNRTVDGSRPRLLDLFCGAGGCSVGYHRAGFDVVGVDINPQPRYPYEFHQGDAMTYPLDGFDVIHASPPCTAYSITRHSHKRQHPDLLPAVRERLEASGLPWVIENVPGAPMPGALVLCGSEFNLTAYDPASGRELMLRRHRLFESNVWLMGAGGCHCNGNDIGGVYGGGSTDRNHARDVRRGGYTPSNTVAKALMGIKWMTRDRLTQAIPPAYTQFIGEQLIEALAVNP